MTDRQVLRRQIRLAAAVDPQLPVIEALAACDAAAGADKSHLEPFAEFFAERGDHDTALSVRELAVQT